MAEAGDPAEARDGGAFPPGVSTTPSEITLAGRPWRGRLPAAPGPPGGSPGEAPPRRDQCGHHPTQSLSSQFKGIGGDATHQGQGWASRPPRRCWAMEGGPLPRGQGQPRGLPGRDLVTWGHPASPLKVGLFTHLCPGQRVKVRPRPLRAPWLLDSGTWSPLLSLPGWGLV